jgi:phosphatidylglycerophosphate synthase
VLCARFAGRDLGISVLLWTLPVIVLYTAFVRCNLILLRRHGGRPAERFELANALTAVRFFLVPCVLVLLYGDERLWGLIVYIAAAATDIADGVVARRLGQETDLGVMLDPVGDIVSTAAVFTYLFHRGIVPSYLFAILIIRYLQFFVGLGVLTMLGVPPRFKATVAGKVVGVVQAIGIVILLAGTVFPGGRSYGTIRAWLLPVLGAAFCSVIISQTVIGLRAVRERGLRSADGQGG